MLYYVWMEINKKSYTLKLWTHWVLRPVLDNLDQDNSLKSADFFQFHFHSPLQTKETFPNWCDKSKLVKNVMFFQSHNWWNFQGAERGLLWSIQVLSMIIMDGPWWSLMVPSKKIEIHDIQLQKCPQLSCFGSNIKVNLVIDPVLSSRWSRMPGHP